jgi:hypothetical protein
MIMKAGIRPFKISNWVPRLRPSVTYFSSILLSESITATSGPYSKWTSA